nr:hypothetical protein [Haslea ostrearia associated bacilladnavirus]
MCRPILHLTAHNGVREIDLSKSLNALAMLNMTGFYNDADYYGIKLWIDAYMQLANAPMPSSVTFKSPCRIDPVNFITLCSDLADEWAINEGQQELEGEDPAIWADEVLSTSDFTVSIDGLGVMALDDVNLDSFFSNDVEIMDDSSVISEIAEI